MEPIVTKAEAVGARIWGACLDMRATNRTITRQLLSDVTGLKMTVIDDHLKRLKADGKLRILVPGVFEPVVEARADRAISTTMVPDADDPVKVEIGDTVLNMSWREARNLGMQLAGIGLLFKG